jgi:hypothetical protein
MAGGPSSRPVNRGSSEWRGNGETTLHSELTKLNLEYKAFVRMNDLPENPRLMNSVDH